MTAKEVTEERLDPALSIKKTPREEVDVFFSVLMGDQWEIIDNPGRGGNSSDLSACCPVILFDPRNGPGAHQEHWTCPNQIRDREGLRQFHLSEETQEGKGSGRVHASFGKGGISSDPAALSGCSLPLSDFLHCGCRRQELKGGSNPRGHL